MIIIMVKPKRYIVWSVNEIDLNNPHLRKWYLQQVLVHGREEDIKELDFDEVKKLLSELNLPPEIRSLWNEIFSLLDEKTAKSQVI